MPETKKNWTFSGLTPDFTPAQLVAVVGAIIGVLVAAGLDLSQGLQDSIIQLVTVIAPLLIVGDGIIRHGRSRAFSEGGLKREDFNSQEEGK